MKRGDLGKRLDYYYHKPEFEIEAQRIRNGIYPLHQLDDKLFCNKITDGTHYTPSYVDDGEDKIKFISVKDVREFEISFEDVKYISEEEHLVLSKRCNPKPGDILLTKIGTIGLAAVIPENAPIFDLFVSVCLIQPKKDIINSHFLCAVLNSPVARLQFARDLKGVGVPDLHLENIAETLIPLPPPEIQSSLVAEIEASRQIRKQKLAQADELLSSLDSYLLDKLGLIPPEESGKKVFAIKLGRIKNGRLDPKFALSEKQESGKFQSYQLGNLVTAEPQYGSGSRAVPLVAPEDIKYIRITDFTNDGIPPGHEFVSAEVIDNEYSLEHEDILFARSGATAGKTFIYTRDIGLAIFAGYCIRFRFNPNLVLPWFVYFYTKTSIYKSWVNSIQRPSGQPNINKEEFKSFTIALPPLEIQHNLVAEMQRRRLEAQRLRQEAETEWEAAKTRFERKLLGEEA